MTNVLRYYHRRTFIVQTPLVKGENRLGFLHGILFLAEKSSHFQKKTLNFFKVYFNLSIYGSY
jgi:hypothetical protein